MPENGVEGAYHKPGPGVVAREAREHGLDLMRCWLIGDILNDVEAGNRAGCRTILLDNGGETKWVTGPNRLPHYVAADLRQASDIISAVDAGRSPGASSSLCLFRHRALGAGAPTAAGSWRPNLKEQVNE